MQLAVLTHFVYLYTITIKNVVFKIENSFCIFVVSNCWVIYNIGIVYVMAGHTDDFQSIHGQSGVSVTAAPIEYCIVNSKRVSGGAISDTANF